MVKVLQWKCSDYDTAVFFKIWGDRSWAIVGFWIDNGTFVGPQNRLLEQQEAFRLKFGISGENILGTSISCNNESHFISIPQKHCIEELAMKFSIQNFRPTKSPILLGITLSIAQPITETEQS